MQYSTRLRDAQNNQIEAILGPSPSLRILTGAAPANAAATQTGTLLVELPLPADWLSASSSGTVSKLGAWAATSVASGDAGYFRVLTSDGLNTDIQGTITATGGGGDITTTNVTISSGVIVSLDTFSITRGNA